MVRGDRGRVDEAMNASEWIKGAAADVEAAAEVAAEKAAGAVAEVVDPAPHACESCKVCLVKALATDHYIVRDIAARAGAGYSLSEKQVALVFKLAREATLRAAEKHAAAPTGRQTVTATVVSAKWKQTGYGYHEVSTLKLTVKVSTPEGTWLAWGSCPGSLSDVVNPGTVLQFTATFEQSPDKAHFAFFKRPTKSSIVGGVQEEEVAA